MKLITNIKDCFSTELISYMLENDGVARPDSDMLGSGGLAEKYSSKGFKLSKLSWETFNSDNLPYDLVLPFKSVGSIKWWFSKLNPGDMFPLHLDTYSEEKDFKRYWVACQDHSPGHIFMYEKEVLTGYSAGDVFEFDAGHIWHGACNLGFSLFLLNRILSDQSQHGHETHQ
jgi:hypothetical protein